MLLGLDIGGANLKASDGDRWSLSRPFPLWKHPERLAAALAELTAHWPGWDGLAVTMTAELADCFATKREGINAVLTAVERVAAGRPVSIWQTGGEFLTLEEACEFPRLVAAANWHALATWAGRMVPDAAGLLIDVGSTTTDLIPLEAGLPAPQGWTDVERLLSGELLYRGVRRTPLCALAQTVPLRGQECPLAAEVFATTLDLALLTGLREEDPSACDTADGRPATIVSAHSRLAHMLCCDVEELTRAEAVAIAECLWRRLEADLSAALERCLSARNHPLRTVLLCGEGEPLVRGLCANHPRLAGAEFISLAESLGPAHSHAACAYALARLGRERLD
jgi:probable H4MPT-linked C1 transfer pathway protein